jgi:hypothetical protein
MRTAPDAPQHLTEWFAKARQYAESIADQWFVVSFRQGLLLPEAPVNPYAECLHRMDRAHRHRWANAVLAALDAHCRPAEHCVILGGVIYRDVLWAGLQRRFGDVRAPLMGSGIFAQLAWFNRMLAQPAA